ncbi:MAG: protein kinase [Proteobacteria bacterium]|nr:protein kinase [Pseudomonadota bacterium]
MAEQPTWEETVARLGHPDPGLRATAAELLGRSLHPAAVPELSRVLADDDDSVVAAALAGLQAIGHPTAVAPLLRLLGSPRLTRREAAAAALGQLAAAQPAMNLETLAATRGDLYKLGLTRDRRCYVPLALALGAPAATSETQAAAARALGVLGDIRAITPLRDALRSSDDLVRGNAVQSLGRLGDIDCLDYFTGRISDPEESSLVRRSSIIALGEFGDLRSVEVLRDHLLPSAGDLRPAVCVALGRIGGLDAVSALRSASTDTDLSVQRAAQRSLDRIANQEPNSPAGVQARALAAGMAVPEPPTPDEPPKKDPNLFFDPTTTLANATVALHNGQISWDQFDELRARAARARPDTGGSRPEALSGIGRLGVYVLLRELGEGGMGTVYVGRHESAEIAASLGGDVAIKIMLDRYAARPKYRARFEREFDVGHRLGHPGIVKVHDLVIDGGRLGVVMALVEGTELGELLHAADGPMDTDKAVSLTIQVLDAMEYAHQQGVIHRDLKPENILVDADGMTHLIDFGLAAFLDDQVARRVEASKVLGTVAYAAPEQLADASQANARSDLYSLGILLFELATKTLPWDPTLPAKTLRPIRLGQPAAPAEQLAPGLDPKVAAAITRATRHEPSERFESCAEFAAVLRQTLAPH